MKLYTDEQGRAAISVAMDMSARAKETAIVRLFAIAQIFYRQPVGEEACDALHELIGADAAAAIFFLAGFHVNGLPSVEAWAKIACIGQ